MKIYNTLTRKKEEFQTIEPGKVRMYVCGPTVYNYIHIGNARAMIVFDTVRRFLEHKGYEVNYVSNFTDVDDKIIKEAIEEGVDVNEITSRFIAAVREDMENLHVRPATVHPKATEEIDGMIEMIQTLIDKGYAYEKNGSVFYRVRKFKDYGKLSGKNLDDLEAGIRIAVDNEKEDPMDFVLWKPRKEGEPAWPSPWSDGRPGWHIECSVMSKRYLGDTIDIHAGGEDLVFPHHENEIAQSEACNGVPFSHYWMHNAFLNIDNRKMSKSLGNFFTVRDIAERYELNAVRFFILSAHYRSPLNFSKELMDAATNGLERIQTAMFNLKHLIAESSKATEFTNDENDLLAELEALSTKFDTSMEDDFNTADAISVIFEIVRLANTRLSATSSPKILNEFANRITELCDILGITAVKEEGLLDHEIEQLIENRQTARKEKNFARADEIRDELLAKGIVLEDTREGVRWKRA